MEDRLSKLLQVYLDGVLQIDTAVAELIHVYVEHGWGFYLIEAECRPEYRDRMRALAMRMEAAQRKAQHRASPLP